MEVAFCYSSQQFAPDSVRQVELVRTAGQDECLEDSTHFALEIRESTALGGIQVLCRFSLEVEHGH